ncbi:hypothetical protein ACO0RG_004231 [Hanseniaspora osmophila]|uniref:Actin-related protein 2/3 complex subunit 5 n=1 Tax=Hanseniaspora osmophila TaxID=56408 RepID=A0A1E5RBV5_9ASCO|nr:Actin-related protein 2/3 complex subunit 5 [Hanseniaspora osmophila]
MEDWRRIDIDALDPENGRLTAADLTKPILQTGEPVYSSQDVQGIMGSLRSYASSGDFTSVVKLITAQPVYFADSEQTKDMYVKQVVESLAQCRTMEISKIVSGLTDSECDVLIKFLYKGMSIPEGAKQGTILLAWLDNIIEKNGSNSIIRYLTDRKTV